MRAGLRVATTLQIWPPLLQAPSISLKERESAVPPYPFPKRNQTQLFSTNFTATRSLSHLWMDMASMGQATPTMAVGDQLVAAWEAHLSHRNRLHPCPKLEEEEAKRNRKPPRPLSQIPDFTFTWGGRTQIHLPRQIIKAAKGAQLAHSTTISLRIRQQSLNGRSFNFLLSF